ncbi:MULTISPECIES: hypothetical protein [Spirulina sp. CCY15215]|uniref:hypothetical protein n=1 Tax=Spirulina sp. CCY15215 TaxID=2767591 RepID=UPI0019524526|nr:hypothetical protein [Spirulina major]
MTVTSETGLKELGDLILNLDRKFDTKFNELDKRIDTKFNELDKKVDTKFSELDKKVDIKISELDKRIDTKFHELDKKIDTQFHELDKRIIEVGKQIDIQSTKIEGTNQRIDDFKEQLNKQDNRLWGFIGVLFTASLGGISAFLVRYLFLH